MPQNVSSPWTFVLDESARILFVDDDPIIREFAAVYLSTPVATVQTAADGEQAWQRLKAEKFDLALVDIEMPVLNGFDLVSRVRADAELGRLPVVMVTGREDIASIDRAYEVGATSFVTKPVNWRQLSHQLRYLLRMSRLESQARAGRDRAESLSSLKGNLLRLFRHEFRTPLASIIGFADIIRKAPENEVPAKHREYADLIASGGQNLLRDLLEMLNFAEIASDTNPLAEEEYDLDDLIRMAVRQAQAESIVKLNLRSAGIGLACDREQFVRMLWHVIDNAVRYGKEDISVSSAIEESGQLAISIRDNGPGIPAERLQSLREPFTQADLGVMRSSGRYGLGLPVAFRIAERHGGKVTIESGVEAGTLVQIRIPAGRVTGALTNAAA